MKQFITTIIKTIAVATVLFSGAVFADAASFDSNPLNVTGITSIVTGTCNGCGGQNTFANANIPDPGDSVLVTVFTDFMTLRNSNQPVQNARAHYATRNTNDTTSTFNFFTSLSAQNAPTIGDSAQLRNLPNSYSIEFVDGFIQNQHGTDGNGDGVPDNICDPSFDYFVGLSSSSNIFSGSGTNLGTLSTDGGSYCAQGTVSIQYRVTNTEVNEPESIIEVETRNVGAVDNNSATLNGRLLDGENINDVWFALTTGSNPSCSNSSQREDVNNVSLDSGDFFDLDVNNLSPDTRYRYRSCVRDNEGNIIPADNFEEFRTDEITSNNSNVDVITLNESDLESDSVTFNGALVSGNNVDVWFAFSTNPSVTCNTGSLVSVPGNFDAGDEFSATINQSIFPDTTYFYVACADDGQTDDQGGTVSFTTPDNDNNDNNNDNNGNNNGNLEVETRREQEVEEDSAQLRGSVDTGDFQDVDVFFAWGEDLSDVEDVENENRFNDIDEDGDNLQVRRIETDFDGDDNFELDVDNLNVDERIYFRICVEYEDNDGDERIECGDVEDFDTDDDGNNNNNNNNNNDVEIRTDSPRNITQTVAEMCGTLQDDGGQSQQTFIEFRRADQNSFDATPIRQRNETSFCERVSGLTPNTTYLYRACTPSGCAPTQTFRTLGQAIPTGNPPVITTLNPTNIQANNATLNGTYVASGNNSRCFFEFGRTAALGSQTITYPVTGVGSCVHNFTQLRANQLYCVRAVIENEFGTDRGSTRCFTTLPGSVPTTGGPSVPTPVPPAPEIIVIDEEEDEELNLGLGLSLVRLEIDNNDDVVTQGESVEYVIEWENISELDLQDLSLRVEIPQEVGITDISRGRLDEDTNTIFFTIDELDGADFSEGERGDNGRMTVSGIVGRGTLGNLLTAEAELAYDNPVNDAQENARDFDLDEYGAQIAGVTASVFGLTNITFLGWLVILLGLFIIFLVARWLYLEREELRAQAYIGGGYQPNYLGYGNQHPVQPQYGNQVAPIDPYAAPAVPQQGYQQPVAQPYTQPPVAPQQAAQEAYYEPYRPNRG